MAQLRPLVAHLQMSAKEVEVVLKNIMHAQWDKRKGVDVGGAEGACGEGGLQDGTCGAAGEQEDVCNESAMNRLHQLSQISFFLPYLPLDRPKVRCQSCSTTSPFLSLNG